jgi:hypothetical protein
MVRPNARSCRLPSTEYRPERQHNRRSYELATLDHAWKGKVARPERFELPTAWFVARYSIQLSYGRVEVLKKKPPKGGALCEAH